MAPYPIGQCPFQKLFFSKVAFLIDIIQVTQMKTKEGLEVEEEFPMPDDFAVVREEFHAVEFIDLDLDFGFIGGVIVATGIVLAKPFVLALF